jgi:hypothetical protein
MSSPYFDTDPFSVANRRVVDAMGSGRRWPRCPSEDFGLLTFEAERVGLGLA